MNPSWLGYYSIGTSLVRPSWNVLFEEEDVSIVLNTHFNLLSVDSLVWGFSRSGFYDSKSGYKLLESIQELQSPAPQPLPPLEKKLWSDLWKTKTSPKLRHFLWRALSGALAVKERLRSRGINLDTTCPLCGLHQETICHVLFTCDVAKETWDRAQIPLPSAGFSHNSVLLNLYHVLSVSKNQRIGQSERLRFPWILWHLWKARNIFCFEQKRFSAANIFSKAAEESSIWFNLIRKDQEEKSATRVLDNGRAWQKPPMGFIKCNLGCSWSASSQHTGASWVIWDF
ncbi:hypothetical protein Bca52824_048106 [Brassica carinata]|uniref:Reverse transcriptase zinc-binding domain-containing protein n=1 Tax=Brassica carinata TaxID=52824 RepID=A0A8X7RIC1_BRACI|nr:hypothetical protein Bca52824_048106 [Brassica carinata]